MFGKKATDLMYRVKYIATVLLSCLKFVVAKTLLPLHW